MPDAVARAILLRSIGRSLRHQLGGIAVAGPLPRGGAVIASNHASWWDGYLLGSLAGAVGQRAAIMMTSRQLARFPFLRLIGAVGTDGARTLARSARDGRWVVVFPEGSMQPGRDLAPLRPGATWIARTARVPVVPVATRVVVRGGPRPEAYVRFGAPLDPRAEPDPEAALAAALRRELAQLDHDLDDADPESVVPGYRLVKRGSAARRDDVGLQVRLLAWLTGQPVGAPDVGALQKDPPR